jgi:hypothetical protein
MCGVRGMAGLAIAVVAACSFDGSRPAGSIDAPEGGGADAPVDGGGAADAPVDGPPPDAPVCEDVCGGSCQDGVCVIVCMGSTDPCSTVNCPAGVPCEVRCIGSGSGDACGTVNCAPGQPCDVICVGGPGVLGGGTGCDLVNCNGACSCEVDCQNGQILGGGTGCQQVTGCPVACENGNDCSAQTPPSECDTCP